MKVVVFSENKQDKEPEVHLQLKQFPTYVELVAVHSETGCLILNGMIARIKEDGTLHLCLGLNPYIGLMVDEKGKIKLS